MPMSRNDLLNAIVDDGIREIEMHYTKPHQQSKREGGVKAFNDCRGKSDEEILALFYSAQAVEKTAKVLSNVSVGRLSTTEPIKFAISEDKYWHDIMYCRQIEWVLNVLSAAMDNQGLTPLTGYTARGVLKAADILGATTI